VRHAIARTRGLTLVELLIGLAITGLIGAAIASMLAGAAHGTSEGNDLRESLVRQRTATARLTAAIRGSGRILAHEPGVLVLWIDDFDGDGQVGVGELQRIERDPVTRMLRSYRATEAAPAQAWPVSANFAAITAGLRDQGYFPAETWATGATGWAVTLDSASLAEASLVSYRLTLQPGGPATADEVIATAALRNER
jgi:type II secretory pathway pseudopilin PulG